VLGATFYAFGFQQERPDADLNLAFIRGAVAVDAVVLIGLIVFFLRATAKVHASCYSAADRSEKRRGSGCRCRSPPWRLHSRRFS
jgi:hypothetical protein